MLLDSWDQLNKDYEKRFSKKVHSGQHSRKLKVKNTKSNYKKMLLLIYFFRNTKIKTVNWFIK
jgi:hypothetical protein